MRWLHDIRKCPVGSDGGGGFRLVWLQRVHQAVKSTEEGLAQPWQVSQPSACATLMCCCTSTRPGSSCCGWHRVLHRERAAVLYSREGTMPKDLNSNSKKGFTDLQRVSKRSLQCCTSDCSSSNDTASSHSHQWAASAAFMCLTETS